MSENDKKDPNLYDQATGREIAASGFPAPTMEEAVNELKIIASILGNHGCATTRDLVAAASVVVDTSHKDAHSRTPEELQSQISEFVIANFNPLEENITKKGESIQKLEDKAKFFARMTSLLFQFARITGATSLTLLREAVDAEKAAESKQVAAVINTNSPEDAIQKLLDIPVKNSYKN